MVWSSQDIHWAGAVITRHKAMSGQSNTVVACPVLRANEPP